MRFLNSSLLLTGLALFAACVHRVPSASEASAPAPIPVADPAPPLIEAAPAVAVLDASTPVEAVQPVPVAHVTRAPATAESASPAPTGTDAEDAQEEAEDEAAGPDEGAAEEEVAEDVPEIRPDGPVYTADIGDEDLARMWKEQLEALGSISVGYVHQGRLINGQQFPLSDDWKVVDLPRTWATQETVDYLASAIRKVKAQYPGAPPLRVNQMSAPEGGHLRPHKSHQNGRDVDLGFYYPTAEPIRVREREKYIDVALNWALVRALITETDVQMILVDRRIINVLYKHALEIGENKEWLDSVFRAGAHSIVRHARRHRDHFHVRFYNPRAQELGRRIVPLLAQRPEQNIVMHRVRRGDTLGAIASRYNASVKAIQRVNRMRGSFLRVGQVLKVQLRGPCTRCPLPPPVVVPKRRLPPPDVIADISSPHAG